LYKTIISFYIVCVALYVFFTRRPDYQDGEFTTGIIHYIQDSTKKPVAKAIFSVNRTQDTIDATYPFRVLKEGQNVTIIYETAEPSKAAVYAWWGYWLQSDELLASVLIPIILFYVAKTITAGPAPEALVEELEMQKPVKRRKYN
jgi:hypothetical protein